MKRALAGCVWGVLLVAAGIWLGACSSFSSSRVDVADGSADALRPDTGSPDVSQPLDADSSASLDLEAASDLDSLSADIGDSVLPDLAADGEGNDLVPPPDLADDLAAGDATVVTTIPIIQNPTHHECDVSLAQPQPVELVRLLAVVVSSPLFSLPNNQLGFYVADPAGGDYSGILIVADAAQIPDAGALSLGTTLDLEGELQEFYCNTQIKLVNAPTIVGSTTPVAATGVTCLTLTGDGERFEGMLVELTDVRVLQVGLPDGDVLIEDANGDSCQLNGAIFGLDAFAVGQRFVTLRGMVNYAFGVYRVQPRSLSDLQAEACTPDAGVCFDAAEPDSVDASEDDAPETQADGLLDAETGDGTDEDGDLAPADVESSDLADVESNDVPDAELDTLDAGSLNQCGNGVRDRHETAVDCGGIVLFVNRINESTGPNEPSEQHVAHFTVAGPQGTDLAGWSAVFYGASTGKLLYTLALDGHSLDQHPSDGLATSTVLSATFPWQTNPTAPGVKIYQHVALALVSPRKRAHDLVGLGSQVPPFEGPAAGLTATVLDVSTGWSASSAVLFYRTGVGSHPSDFAWLFGAVQPDAANPGQQLVATCGPCQLSQGCVTDLDCTGSVCTNGVCSTCGDGIRDQGEQCDDGNVVNGDYCTNACKNSCPYGDKKSVTADSCVMYFRAVTKVNWLTAHERCLAIGAHLLRITSQEENERVVALMSSFDFAWIGLNDRDSEGNPVWALADGQSDPSAPYGVYNNAWPNTDGSDCVMIFGGTSTGVAVGRWGYSNCATQLYWFCEYEFPQ